jgi:hypothetical protein
LKSLDDVRTAIVTPTNENLGLADSNSNTTKRAAVSRVEATFERPRDGACE